MLRTFVVGWAGQSGLVVAPVLETVKAGPSVAQESEVRGLGPAVADRRGGEAVELRGAGALK